MSQAIGAALEDEAKRYLLAQGLYLITSNYHCRCGEIDLVMRDASFLVFVEVRARRSMRFGGAMASVTQQKRRKLVRTANHYLMTHRLYEKHPTRFDVVCFEGNQRDMVWLKHAFTLDDI